MNITRARRGLSTLTLLVAAALTLLTGCQGDATPTPQAGPADDILAAHGLEGLDVRAVIDELDALPLEERPADLFASIRPGELFLADGTDREASLPMPEDETYISIAPYVTQTHECHFHSLTTCVGELGATDVDVLITDDVTGEVLVEGEHTTFDNGFVGFWLPRGNDVTVTVERDGLSATTTLSTDGAEDATCVTTLQLA